MKETIYWCTWTLWHISNTNFWTWYRAWGFKGTGTKKLGKINPNFYKFTSGTKQSTTDNSVYGELGARSCQVWFRWNQVKFWNRLTGLSQCWLAIKPYRLLLNLDNYSSFVINTKIHQVKIHKLSSWNSQQQIPNCHINSEVKENIL